MAEGTEEVPRGLRSEMATLSGLFTRGWVYRMPPFQRAYSWTDEEVDCLVEDLRVATAYEYPYYFVGHIVIHAQDNDGLVIDGQQRLATLTLLLAYLRDKAEDKSLARALQWLIAVSVRSQTSPRLMLRPLDCDFFARWVQSPGKIADLASAKAMPVKSQRLIQLAARHIAKALDELTEQEREAMARFLASKVTFNLIQTDDLEGASALFRVINYSGLRPSDSTIIRSELLERAQLSHGEAAAIADRWDNLEDQFGDQNMADFWSLLEVIVSGQPPGDKHSPRTFRGKVIEQVDAGKFLREDLWRYAYAFGDVLECAVDAGPASAEVNRRIACLHLWREHGWLAPAVAMIADHHDDPDLLANFFRGLDRLTFACVMGIITNHRRRERFARVVRANGAERALFGRDGALQLTRGQAEALIGKLNLPLGAEDNRARLVALRINAALPGGEALKAGDNITLEHILPKSDSEYWRKKFPKDERREEYKYLLGNFALLNRRQNDEAANADWETKRQVYFKTARAPVRALTADVEKYKDWNETALRTRHVSLVRALDDDLDL